MRAMISGIGHYVPERILTNKDLEEMVDTNDEWIMTRTGIKERRILDDGKGTSFMAARAAEKALAMANVPADEIDLIIVATVTPDMFVPSAAALVQKELNAANCWGFDLNGACSGFLYALSTGTQFIESGRYKKVLVIGADKMSAITDYENRNTCVLFGDAAGAVLLEPSEDESFGIHDFLLHIDGKGADHLRIEAGGSLRPTTIQTVEKKMHYLFQDGKKVFKHAVVGMADVSENILKQNGLTGKDIKLLIPHQANLRIIDAVVKRLKLKDEQIVINIKNYGNTTAATIPLAMSESYLNGAMERGDKLVLSAFGAGYTWGSVLLTWAI